MTADLCNIADRHGAPARRGTDHLFRNAFPLAFHTNLSLVAMVRGGAEWPWMMGLLVPYKETGAGPDILDRMTFLITLIANDVDRLHVYVHPKLASLANHRNHLAGFRAGARPARTINVLNFGGRLLELDLAVTMGLAVFI